MPPMFIIKAASEQLYEEILSKVSGVAVIATENAWIDTWSFIEWLTKIFVPYSGASPTSRKLLLLDNHSTRYTFEAILAADQNGVDLYCLPSHASHFMQPLDQGVFGPLKLTFNDRWVSIVVESSVTLDRLVLIQTVMQTDVFYKAFSIKNIACGWRKSGLYPFNIKAADGHLSAERKDNVIQRNTDGKVACTPIIFHYHHHFI